MLFSNGGKVSECGHCGEQDVMPRMLTDAANAHPHAATHFPPRHAAPPPFQLRRATSVAPPQREGATSHAQPKCGATRLDAARWTSSSATRAGLPLLHTLRQRPRRNVTLAPFARSATRFNVAVAGPNSSACAALQSSEESESERQLRQHTSPRRPTPSQLSPRAHATASEGVRRNVGLAPPTELGCTRLVQAKVITASNAELR
ncbi:hypothetical protein B0H14DRAFT_2576240 [Mycena olivaceomarginata]|nr:hypothetical protein B0H14DRAFT_2576240 [Mycena olivaceomarginata]